MNPTRIIFLLVLAVILIGGIYAVVAPGGLGSVFTSGDIKLPAQSDVSYTPAGAADMIRIASPQPGDIVVSPLHISGEARGTWYFEGSFPVMLVDWDGRIIADGVAQARGEWMTEEFVPFSATLTFVDPSNDEPYSQRGAVILQRDNPSGLPENSAAAEIPVRFR